MSDNTKQCTNCKVFRDKSEFIGKKLVEVKRCQKCRDKDDRQKQRPEVREKHNVRQSENKYYQESRERKREENEKEFLSHNAQNMKEWRDNNKEHVREWKMTNANYRLTAIKQQAKLKNIPWDDATMTKEYCVSLMNADCHYCNLTDTDRVNGIDRMDNFGGYTKTNCVPCCKVCNFMKRCLDPSTFVERCCHIAHHNGYPCAPTHENAWPTTSRSSFVAYKDRAVKKEVQFELTENEFYTIAMGPCRYCNRLNSSNNGIDRINNTIGYIKDNCTPCCSECNYMKSDLSIDEFLQTCILVAKRQESIHIPSDIKRCYRCITRRTDMSQIEKTR